MIPVIIILVICFALLAYTNSKTNMVDKMTTAPSSPSSAHEATETVAEEADESSANSYASNKGTSSDVLSPNDLLPNDPSATAATPSTRNIAMPDLLNSGYHLGLDTIGQSLKTQLPD
jgi:cytoskeletal protein RodZ